MFVQVVKGGNALIYSILLLEPDIEGTTEEWQVTSAISSLIPGLLAAVILVATAGHATTIHVPADQPTIQAGIDAAVDGDTVLVADGTYSGTGNYNISIMDKGITVLSENGPHLATIDCLQLGCAFLIDNCISAQPVIEGFTIRHGDGGWNGGAIESHNASPTIAHCLFMDNIAHYGGCLKLDGNPRESDGLAEVYPIVTNCTFVNNQAHRGGAVMFVQHGCHVTIQRIIVTSNVTGQWYGGSPIAAGLGGYIESLENSNVSGNSPGDWIGHIAPFYGVDGNLMLEPAFCNPLEGNYSLDSGSVFTPWHPLNTCGQLIGALPPACGETADTDTDGVVDIEDNCPLDHNPVQADADADYIGDACDPCQYDPENDTDADSVCGDVDNCPYTYNPDQADSDGDGLGDSCDCCRYVGDVDHDGVDGDPSSGIPNIADLVYLVTFMFDYVPFPPCEVPPSHWFPETDIDGNGVGPDIADLVYLVTYMFQGGPHPVGWIDYWTPACNMPEGGLR